MSLFSKKRVVVLGVAVALTSGLVGMETASAKLPGGGYGHTKQQIGNKTIYRSNAKAKGTTTTCTKLKKNTYMC